MLCLWSLCQGPCVSCEAGEPGRSHGPVPCLEGTSEKFAEHVSSSMHASTYAHCFRCDRTVLQVMAGGPLRADADARGRWRCDEQCSLRTHSIACHASTCEAIPATRKFLHKPQSSVIEQVHLVSPFLPWSAAIITRGFSSNPQSDRALFTASYQRAFEQQLLSAPTLLFRISPAWSLVCSLSSWQLSWSNSYFWSLCRSKLRSQPAASVASACLSLLLCRCGLAALAQTASLLHSQAWFCSWQ